LEIIFSFRVLYIEIYISKQELLCCVFFGEPVQHPTPIPWNIPGGPAVYNHHLAPNPGTKAGHHLPENDPNNT